MKDATLLRKLNQRRNEWLRRIAFQIYLAAWHDATHATWSWCGRCKKIKQTAIESIRLVRSLRSFEDQSQI